mmetsp:Transcript_39542/g.77252  ORF Transcript_39542/g.77252 Transcript_39542/m.77252 type:complete len:142 (-) Transcript_39542:31-456(-)
MKARRKLRNPASESTVRYLRALPLILCGIIVGAKISTPCFVGTRRLSTTARYLGAATPFRTAAVAGQVMSDRAALSERRAATVLLSASEDGGEDGNEVIPPTGERGGFDGAGLASYLAPYALGLLLSVAATAAFFKFVLMG